MSNRARWVTEKAVCLGLGSSSVVMIRRRRRRRRGEEGSGRGRAVSQVVVVLCRKWRAGGVRPFLRFEARRIESRRGTEVGVLRVFCSGRRRPASSARLVCRYEAQVACHESFRFSDESMGSVDGWMSGTRKGGKRAGKKGVRGRALDLLSSVE